MQERVRAQTGKCKGTDTHGLQIAETAGGNLQRIDTMLLLLPAEAHVPRAEMDGLIALSCMTEAAENGKEGHPGQGAWPCRSPWPGSAPLLGPLPEHSMRSPVVVSRIGQGLRGGGESAVCAKFEESEPSGHFHQGLPDLAPCCAGSFPSSTLIHARPVEDFGFLWLHATSTSIPVGGTLEESGVAANHHLGSSFLILLLLDARREC